jgi:soluble lytic murein transglycosylase-like protein
VPAGYRHVAGEYGVPSSVLYAVALTESGTVIDSMRAVRPWPWTLNVSGKGYFYPTRKAAAEALALVLASGRESVDIGLMQVNWRYHKKRLASPQLAIEPYHNLRVAAQILQGCFRSRKDWWEAIGCYHAPSKPSRAARYRERVFAHWQRVVTRG